MHGEEENRKIEVEVDELFDQLEEEEKEGEVVE